MPVRDWHTLGDKDFEALVEKTETYFTKIRAMRQSLFVLANTDMRIAMSVSARIGAECATKIVKLAPNWHVMSARERTLEQVVEICMLIDGYARTGDKSKLEAHWLELRPLFRHKMTNSNALLVGAREMLVPVMSNKDHVDKIEAMSFGLSILSADENYARPAYLKFIDSMYPICRDIADNWALIVD